MKKIIAVLAVACGGFCSGRVPHAYGGRVRSRAEVRFLSNFFRYIQLELEAPEPACAAGGYISTRCLDALADAGQIPRKVSWQPAQE